MNLKASSQQLDHIGALAAALVRPGDRVASAADRPRSPSPACSVNASARKDCASLACPHRFTEQVARQAGVLRHP